ncbi:unnamed protein product [Ixodes pacificus]
MAQLYDHKLPEYVFTEKLGQGTYATVFKAYHKMGARRVVAIKCISKSSLTKSATENLLTEIAILKKIKNEHIVELIDFQWNQHFIYLIMEYCSGGDLHRYIRANKRLRESIVRKFLQQLAKALQVLQEHNIAHMDLKPQNILLSSVRTPLLKLAGQSHDFGISGACMALVFFRVFLAIRFPLVHGPNVKLNQDDGAFFASKTTVGILRVVRNMLYLYTNNICIKKKTRIIKTSKMTFSNIIHSE